MGIDRRIVDKDGNEALVDATLEALKVDVVTETTGILATIDGVLDAIQTLLEGTQKVKVWDGSGELALKDHGDEYSTSDQGVILLAVNTAAGTYSIIPVALATDSLETKGHRVIPVTPMTAELIEGTKITDGSETLLIDGNGKLGAVVAQATPANLKTAIYGLNGEGQVQIKVDESGKLKVTF